MNFVIDEIVKEWSSEIPSGIIDGRNENHLYTLSQILNRRVDNPMVVHELMESIRTQMREDY